MRDVPCWNLRASEPHLLQHVCSWVCVYSRRDHANTSVPEPDQRGARRVPVSERPLLPGGHHSRADLPARQVPAAARQSEPY